MIQQRKLNTIILPVLFAIGIIVPFTYALLKQFYFYQAILAGLILLPILLIPLMRAPRKTLLAFLLVSVSINPSFPFFQNDSFIFPLSIKFWLSDLILLSSWCYILLKQLNRRSEYSRLIQRHSGGLLLFFLLWIAFGLSTMVFAVDKTIVIIELTKMARVLFIYLTIPFFIESKKDLTFIAICLVGAVLFQALLIFAQYATGDQVIRLPGGSRDLDITAAGTLFRPGGTMGHSSNFAKLSALVLPVCLVLQQYYPSPSGRKIFGSALIIIFVSTVIVVSRIGLATAVLGIGLMLSLSLKTAKGRRLFLLTLFVCFLAFSAAWFVGGARIVDRIAEDAHSAESRIPMWLTALQVIKDHPLGVGLNNYLHIAPQYDKYGIIAQFPFPVHNIYLLNFAELGIVGGSCFIGLLIAAVLLAFKASRKARDDLDAAILQAMGIGITCSWLQGMVGWGHRSSFAHLPYFAIFAGTIVAYNYLVRREKDADKTH